MCPTVTAAYCTVLCSEPVHVHPWRGPCDGGEEDEAGTRTESRLSEHGIQGQLVVRVHLCRRWVVTVIVVAVKVMVVAGVVVVVSAIVVAVVVVISSRCSSTLCVRQLWYWLYSEFSVWIVFILERSDSKTAYRLCALHPVSLFCLYIMF